MQILQEIALAVRVGPTTSRLITESSEHEADGGEMQKCERLSIEILPVFGQSSAATKPRNRSFNNPPPWQDLKAFGRVGTFDDFGHEAGQGFLLRIAKLWSLIAAISEQLLKKRKFPKQCA